METDLFLNKSEQLEKWMRQKHRFATHEVMAWGNQHFYNRAPNTKSDFLKRGLIRKIADEDKALYGYKCKDSVYEWVG